MPCFLPFLGTKVCSTRLKHLWCRLPARLAGRIHQRWRCSATVTTSPTSTGAKRRARSAACTLESWWPVPLQCLDIWNTKRPSKFPGWWFGNVWDITFIFPYIGNKHPNWLMCFRGVETTNLHFFSNSTAPSGLGKFDRPEPCEPWLIWGKSSLSMAQELRWLELVSLTQKWCQSSWHQGPLCTRKLPRGPCHTLAFFPQHCPQQLQMVERNSNATDYRRLDFCTMHQWIRMEFVWTWILKKNCLCRFPGQDMTLFDVFCGKCHI